MKNDEFVVIVDKEDNFISIMEKEMAHIKGILHRAFSIFIFNDKKQILLQQRSKYKYHSPLLWTNTCCSHPKLNESYIDAANRRLLEEMGMQCNLNYILNFIYKEKINNMIEHELDYVFFGTTNIEPKINILEVENYKWVDIDWLLNDIIKNEHIYTIWLKIIIKNYIKYFYSYLRM